LAKAGRPFGYFSTNNEKLPVVVKQIIVVVVKQWNRFERTAGKPGPSGVSTTGE
jgi:hypothetical protein